MSDEFIIAWGYFGLFAVTFLSSSLAPLISQPVLFAMERLGYNVWLILAVATAGNYFGSLTTYAIGRYGGNRVMARWIRPNPARLEQAKRLFNKWGVPILLFSWIPIIGDALVLAAGLFKSKIVPFTLWLLPGKWLHFAVGMGLFRLVIGWFG